MALTSSHPFPLGSIAPTFELKNVVTNKLCSLQQLKGSQLTVIMFICNHCPYVIHVNQALIRLANDYSSKGVAFIAISANDAVQYPADSPDNMKAQAEKLNYPFPYLYDETQQIARAYDAACTPDFYIFNEKLACIYHGQLDDARPRNNLPTDGKSMRNALNLWIEEKKIVTDQKPSIGCGIKWK